MENPEVANNAPASEEAVEAEVNAAAQAETKPAEQVEATGNKSPVSGTASTDQKTVSPNTVAKVEPEFDVRKSYEELRKDYTRKTQSLSNYEKQIAKLQSDFKTVQERLEVATKKPVNLEQFFVDLKAQGPDAILPYFKPELEKMQTAFNEKLQAHEQEKGALRIEVSLLNRRMDSANYPDFNVLEPKMREILESGKAPIDQSRPLDEIIDTLYTLARSQNSEVAIRQAEKAGYSKAQADLAKEAKTAVAGGGKGVSATPGDMWKMPLDKLEALVNQMHGVADRD